MTYSVSQTSSKPFFSLGFPDPKEFYYICAIGNLSSILNHGILSRKKVMEKGIRFFDPSNSETQLKRENKSPLNKPPHEDNLHHYVNLYFNAFNRTLSNFYKDNPDICVLRIHRNIFKKKGCIVADRNAATYQANFSNPGEVSFDGLSSIFLHVPRARFLAGDLPECIRSRANQVKQAELLVPSKVSSRNIKGIFVQDNNMKRRVTEIFNFPEKVTIHPSLFFAVNKNPFWLDEIDAPELSDTGIDSDSDDSDSENRNPEPLLDIPIPKSPMDPGFSNEPWGLPRYHQIFTPFPYPYSPPCSPPYSPAPVYNACNSIRSRIPVPISAPNNHTFRYHPYAPNQSASLQPTRTPLIPINSNLPARSGPIRTQKWKERRWRI